MFWIWIMIGILLAIDLFLFMCISVVKNDFIKNFNSLSSYTTELAKIANERAQICESLMDIKKAEKEDVDKPV